MAPDCFQQQQTVMSHKKVEFTGENQKSKELKQVSVWSLSFVPQIPRDLSHLLLRRRGSDRVGEDREGRERREAEIVTPSVLPHVSRKEGQNCEQDVQRVRRPRPNILKQEAAEDRAAAGVRNVCTSSLLRTTLPERGSRPLPVQAKQPNHAT